MSRGMGWRMLLHPIIRPNRQSLLGWSIQTRQSMRTDPNLKPDRAVIMRFTTYNLSPSVPHLSPSSMMRSVAPRLSFSEHSVTQLAVVKRSSTPAPATASLHTGVKLPQPGSCLTSISTEGLAVSPGP